MPATGSSLPADVWSVILTFLYVVMPPSEWRETDRQWFQTAPPPWFWGFSRTIAEGLDLWILSVLTDELQRTNGILRFGNPHVVPVLRFGTFSQKRTVLALSRAPKEFLSSITRLEGSFFSTSRLSRSGKSQGSNDPFKAIAIALAGMDRLTFISGPCLQKFEWIQSLNLLHLSELRVIGNEFLSYSSVEELFLPAGLEQVGNKFLTESKIKALDLSMTRLTQVGDEFLKGTPLRCIRFPTTLRIVGAQFLAAVGRLEKGASCSQPPTGGSTNDKGAPSNHFIPQLDLSETILEKVGDGFLSDSSIGEILLPATLQTSSHDDASTSGP